MGKTLAPDPIDPPHRRGHFRVIDVLVVVLILGTLLALLIPAVQSAREAARRSQCLCNFCQLSLALHNYHEAYGVFPPAFLVDPRGRPAHSWRVLILPYMEQQALSARYRFAEPWDGPNNRTLPGPMPPCYDCPSRSDSGGPAGPLTSYVAITGPGTIFPGPESVAIGEIRDGTSRTLLLAEATNTAIPWMAPRDLDVRSMSFRVNDRRRPAISSPHPGGANVAFADGSYRFLPETVTPGHLRALTTIRGGEAVAPP
jgi:prepilin-type processing-associated H-X9-DG protein